VFEPTSVGVVAELVGFSLGPSVILGALFPTVTAVVTGSAITVIIFTVKILKRVRKKRKPFGKSSILFKVINLLFVLIQSWAC